MSRSEHTSARPLAVVLLSGGLDSMVTAALAQEAGFAVHALTVDYGQRHRLELESATRIAERLGLVQQTQIALDLRAFGGSALTDAIDVPKGGVGHDIPVTYVPARNLVFLALTTACAEAAGARDVFIGVNALDYSGYPDCAPSSSLASQRQRGLEPRQVLKARRLPSTRRCNPRPRPTSPANVQGLGWIPHGVGHATIRHRMGWPADCAIHAASGKRVLPKPGLSIAHSITPERPRRRADYRISWRGDHH